MSIGDLKKLRDNLPQLFLDWEVPQSWGDELAFFPVDSADSTVPSDIDAFLSPLASDTISFIPVSASVATTGSGCARAVRR
jgi:hypothetical protein